MLTNLLTYCLFHWIGFQLPILLSRPLITLILLLLITMVSLSRKKANGYSVLLTLSFALSGILVSQLYGHVYFSQWRPELGKNIYKIQGSVEKRIIKPYGEVISLKLRKVDNQIIDHYWINQMIKVTFATKYLELLPPVKLNDSLEFDAKLRQVTGYENEFGFNYPQWLFSHKVIATGSYTTSTNSLKVKSLKYTRSSNSVTMVALATIKTHLLELSYGRFIWALLLADKSYFNESDHEALKRWGLSHLFAISGLHIGILVGLLIFLFRYLGRYLPLFSQLITIHLISVSFVWTYLSIIGFPVSATRATLLLSACLAMLHTNQSLSSFSIIGLVMLVSLVIDPTNILNASWWLSISAVFCLFVIFRLGIMRIYNPNIGDSEETNRKRLFPDYIKTLLWMGRTYCWQLVKLQCLLTLAMLPVVIYWMQGIPVLGIVNNLVAIPVFSLLLVPGIFLATFTLFVHEEAGMLLYTTINWVFEYLWLVLTSIPRNDLWLNVPSHYCWYLIFLYIALFYFKEDLNWKKRVVKMDFWSSSMRLSVCVGLAMILFCGLKWRKPIVSFRIYDVGQGTSVLVESDETRFLYDLGPIYSSGSSATDHVVKPNLFNANIWDLDLLVISHADSDHRGDLNALEAVTIERLINSCAQQPQVSRNLILANLKVERIWPMYDIDKKMANSSPQISQTLTNLNVDSTRKRPKVFSQNAMSCVIKVTEITTEHSILLTGDIDLVVENILAEQHVAGTINLKSDVLLSSHHGSKFGSSSLFLRLVSPDIVVHSAGVNNRFNFPSKEVVSRLDALNIRQVSTSHLGEISIEFTSNQSNFTLNFALNFWTPFWKRQNPFSIHHQIR